MGKISVGKISGGENFATPKKNFVTSCAHHSPWDMHRIHKKSFFFEILALNVSLSVLSVLGRTVDSGKSIYVRYGCTTSWVDLRSWQRTVITCVDLSDNSAVITAVILCSNVVVQMHSAVHGADTQKIFWD